MDEGVIYLLKKELLMNHCGDAHKHLFGLFNHMLHMHEQDRLREEIGFTLLMTLVVNIYGVMLSAAQTCISRCKVYIFIWFVK